MPSTTPSMAVIHGRSPSFYSIFERKEDGDPEQTHYCPGCGHGIVTKLVAEAIDSLGIQDTTVLFSPVGCSVFGYEYLDVGNVQVAHGRAPAAATAFKRARPMSVVLAYQGDGDLGAIGTAEIVHAANRGDNITVIFVNNAIYGMTGGQMAPTTLLGQKSTTTPLGREASLQGYPLRVCELLATLEAPAYLERVALGSNKQIMAAARAIRRAIENQVEDRGFSLVEVLSPCPTVWGLEPVEAEKFVRETMTRTFPLGNFRQRSEKIATSDTDSLPVGLAELPRVLGLGVDPTGDGLRGRLPVPPPPQNADHRIIVAGFGGQGVLMLGELLADAGLGAGYHVSWLPSYGPQMRSGTSNCHVRLSAAPVDSPLVSRPTVLIALNEPSLRRFLPAVEPGGLVLYNADAMPSDCSSAGLHVVALAATAIADELGSAKAGNLVLLGALLEATSLLPDIALDDALRRRITEASWFQLDRRALEAGRAAARRMVSRRGASR